MTEILANISEVFAQLNEFRTSGKYCDVTIRVHEEGFKCHRLILAATCAVFDKMFEERSEGTFRESVSEEISLDNINGLDAATFREVLQFAYTGKVVVTSENAYNLILVSEYLGLSYIEEMCIKYIEQNIPIQNATAIYVFACLTSKDSLRRVISEYILKNFRSISKTVDFLQIPFNDFFLLLKQYRDSTSSLRNKDSLLDTIMRWVHHAQQERMSHLDKLLNFVDDFAEISPDYMKFMIRKYLIPADTTGSSVALGEYIPRKPSALHVFVQLGDSWNIFSLNEYNIEGYHSCKLLPSIGNVVFLPHVGNNSRSEPYSSSSVNSANVGIRFGNFSSSNNRSETNNSDPNVNSAININNVDIIRSTPLENRL